MISRPNPQTSTNRTGFTLICAAILLISLSVRLWNLGTQSLWHDEAWSVFSGYTPFAPMGLRGADVNAPAAYYASLGLWLRLTGDSVWAMRALSAFYGVITVAVTILVARTFYNGRAAIVAGILVALNPTLWVFSQEIRAYVTMPLMALVLLYLLNRLLAPNTHRRFWIWIAFAEFFTLYAHNLAVPVVAWLNVAAGLGFLLTRQFRKLGLWIAVQVGIFILYLPWLLTQRPTGTALNNPPAINAQLLWDIWQSFFTGIRSLINADPVLSALIAAFGVLCVVGVIIHTVLVFRRGDGLPRPRESRIYTGRGKPSPLLLSQILLIPIFELAIIYAANIDFHPRYFIVSIPATLIGIAAVVSSSTPSLIPDAKNGVPTKRIFVGTWPAASAVLLNVLLILTAGLILSRMTAVMYGSPVHQHDDFRAIADRYAKLGSDARIVIPYGGEPTLDYYRAHLNIKAQFVEIPLHSSGETIIRRLTTELESARHVEILTWYQLPADVRGAYSCIIGAMGSRGDSLTVNGLHTQAYTDLRGWKQSGLGDPVTPNADFGLIRGRDTWLSIVGLKSACMITAWTLQEPTPSPLQLSTRLVTDSGTFAGQMDRALLSDRQAETTVWKPGDEYYAFSQIDYPETSPDDQSVERFVPSFMIYTLPTNNLTLRLPDGATDPAFDPLQARFGGFSIPTPEGMVFSP